MSNARIPGKISFIHHEKNRAIIEYDEKGKKKTIQANLSEVSSIAGSAKNTHRFLMGDNVTFEIKKTGANGKVQIASRVQYQYNTGLEILLHKAKLENKFIGYIKLTGNEYFIKEIDSYLFFPLKISEYEIAPPEADLEKPVSFKLNNLEKPDKLFATLFNRRYLPEFEKAVQHFKKQTIITATVTKITAFGVYVDLISDKIAAKLPIDEELSVRIASKELVPGSTIDVKIKHLGAEKIVIEKAG